MTNTSSRLQSLDVFRGLTVMIMTLVNNPGDWGHIYPPLEHAAWNGCTLADLVFPSFLFIVGVSIVFAMQTAKQQPENHGRLMVKILKRALIIAALGLFMSFFLNWDFSTLRFPGVLQRIAVVYLICGLIFIKSGYRFQAILAIIILVGYHLLMTKVPVPDTGVASLQPETNLGAWLDRNVFTTAHLWKQSKTWDPEGLLSTLPAIATGLLGVLTGTWLKHPTYSPKIKVYGMLAAGALLMAAGLLWNIWLPINKALWTSSFVLFTGGIGLLFFALCYWLIDIEGYQKAIKPFVVYGVNAITVFVVSGLAARSMNRIMVNHDGSKTSLSNALYQQFFVPHFSPLNASLAWAIAYVLVWMMILWVMYNKRIFIKI
ncbi:heparan-alpha-glucosaminide N-acetyltransferase domain-containing protein [Mucilaginibacter sp. CSA2-8R]|uniref:acyltransferase family protein n=1 Tax=Mucilaginibacter sp. CSA2-8R TaxID=3141542 RepID=UPI00315D3F03